MQDAIILVEIVVLDESAGMVDEPLVIHARAFRRTGRTRGENGISAARRRVVNNVAASGGICFGFRFQVQRIDAERGNALLDIGVHQHRRNLGIAENEFDALVGQVFFEIDVAGSGLQYPQNADDHRERRLHHDPDQPVVGRRPILQQRRDPISPLVQLCVG